MDYFENYVNRRRVDVNCLRDSLIRRFRFRSLNVDVNSVDVSFGGVRVHRRLLSCSCVLGTRHRHSSSSVFMDVPLSEERASIVKSMWGSRSHWWTLIDLADLISAASFVVGIMELHWIVFVLSVTKPCKITWLKYGIVLLVNVTGM